LKVSDTLSAQLEQLSLSGKKTPQKKGAKHLPTVLLERLGDFDPGYDGEGFGLAAIPPSYVMVANKPQLFDLALNYMEMPNIDEKAGVKAEARKSGGLFGWFRG